MKPDTDFTVELSVKPSEAEGVIFHYNGESGIILYLDSVFKVQIGGNVYITSITVDLHAWQQITMVWYHSARMLILYVCPITGSCQDFTITNIDSTAFNNYGYIGLGHPTSATVSAIGKYYVGEIDELRIWHTAFMYTNVELRRLSRITSYGSLLVSHWSFDDGEGGIITDRVQQNNINVINFGVLRTAISWRISYLPLTAPSIPYLHSFTNLTKMQEAETQCNSLVYNSSLSTTCSGFSVSLLNFYYVSCVSDLAASDLMLSSMYVIVTMSDHCWLREELSVWPGRSLCEYFDTFPGWKGSQCDIPCDFPADDNSTSPQCICHDGYWGPACNKTCPGGADNPCSGKGQCNQTTGTCGCSFNWDGTKCNACASGWYGNECSINVQPLSGQKHLCAISGNGHLTMLDGASTIFEEYGYYTFFKSSALEIEVETAPCGRFPYCILDFHMKADNKLLSVSAIAEGEIMLDGVVTSVYKDLTISSNYEMSRLDAKSFQITGPNSLRIVLYMEEGYINVQLETQQSDCGSSEGLCGACATRAHSCSSSDAGCLLQYEGVARTCQSLALSSADIYHYYNLWHVDYISSFRAQVFILIKISKLPLCKFE